MASRSEKLEAAQALAEAGGLGLPGTTDALLIYQMVVGALHMARRSELTDKERVFLESLESGVGGKAKGDLSVGLGAVARELAARQNRTEAIAEVGRVNLQDVRGYNGGPLWFARAFRLQIVGTVFGPPESDPPQSAVPAAEPAGD